MVRFYQFILIVLESSLALEWACVTRGMLTSSSKGLKSWPSLAWVLLYTWFQPVNFRPSFLFLMLNQLLNMLSSRYTYL